MQKDGGPQLFIVLLHLVFSLSLCMQLITKAESHFLAVLSISGRGTARLDEKAAVFGSRLILLPN